MNEDLRDLKFMSSLTIILQMHYLIVILLPLQQPLPQLQQQQQLLLLPLLPAVCDGFELGKKDDDDDDDLHQYVP